MAEAKPRVRKFLVVVDKTPECRVALRYAARRAQHTTGRVTLLAIAAPPDFQQWRGVESIMEDEAHAEAEALVHAAAKTVNELAGVIPELVILQGRKTDCVRQVLKEDKALDSLRRPDRRRRPGKVSQGWPLASRRQASQRGGHPERGCGCRGEGAG